MKERIREEEQAAEDRPRKRRAVICPLCGHTNGQVCSQDGEFELTCYKCKSSISVMIREGECMVMGYTRDFDPRTGALIAWLKDKAIQAGAGACPKRRGAAAAQAPAQAT